jgi:hypothetical protein
MDEFDDACDASVPGTKAAGEVRSHALYRLVIPRQDVAVRLVVLLWPVAPEDAFLSAVKPYGMLRMAWAIWREVPHVAPKEALTFALEARRKGEAEALIASGLLAEHVRTSLLVRHRLAAWLEPVR